MLATATTYLLKYGYSQKNNIHYYKYYDIINLNINGEKYQGIVLDSCGACMKNNIIDLFVTNKNSSLTTMITIE